MSSSKSFKKRQSSIIFAKGTKRHDGGGGMFQGDLTATGGGEGNSSRDSQAWAGIMMGGDLSSDDESDSDHSDQGQSRIPPPASTSSTAIQKNDVRASWTTRAAAVGSRPPDTASQNPPSLKLLGLKSLKEGGIPMGNNGQAPPMSPALSMRQQVERRQMEEQQLQQQRRDQNNIPTYPTTTSKDTENLRIGSGSDYGNDVDRHGSMINFGGSDGFGNANGPRSNGLRGVELHDEPVRSFEQRSSPDRRQQPQQQQNTSRPPPLTLQPPENPFANQPMSPKTANLTQQLGLADRTPSPIDGRTNGQRLQQPPPNQRNLISPSAEGPTMRSTDSRYGQPSSGFGQRSGNMGPNNVDSQSRRGPPPPLSLTPGNGMIGMPSGPQRGAPPSPHPIPIPSPVHMPQGGQRIPPGSMPRMQQQQPPPQQQPNFSNAPQGGPRHNPPARRPSLFRRSKAFLMGNNAPSQQQQQQQQQRRSIFRRSMAMLTGNRNEMMPPSHGQNASDSTDDDDSNAPAPRVQGFIDEKPRDRKSYFLGGGGMGDEWDYSGYGAKFWRRFSAAQHKLNAGELKDMEEKRKKAARRRKCTMISSLIGGLFIISAVVAIVIWRETIPEKDPRVLNTTIGGTSSNQMSGKGSSSGSGSGSGSGQSSVASTNNNAVSSVNDDTTDTTGAAASTSDPTTLNDGTTTTTKKHHKHHHKHSSDETDDSANNRRRSFDEVYDNVEMIKRQVEHVIPSSRSIKPIEGRASLHSASSMIRKRRNLIQAVRS